MGLRNDTAGFGYYGAPRGFGRKHNGKDYLCKPGQDVYCPIDSGKIVRRARPYNDDTYQGVLIEGRHITVMLFYVDIWEFCVGKYVKRDEVIGIAQDITNKYSDQMKPHIHLTVVSVDPEFLE